MLHITPGFLRTHPIFLFNFSRSHFQYLFIYFQAVSYTLKGVKLYGNFHFFIGPLLLHFLAYLPSFCGINPHG